jgi:hypothetical protein
MWPRVRELVNGASVPAIGAERETGRESAERAHAIAERRGALDSLDKGGEEHGSGVQGRFDVSLELQVEHEN